MCGGFAVGLQWVCGGVAVDLLRVLPWVCGGSAVVCGKFAAGPRRVAVGCGGSRWLAVARVAIGWKAEMNRMCVRVR